MIDLNLNLFKTALDTTTVLGKVISRRSPAPPRSCYCIIPIKFPITVSLLVVVNQIKGNKANHEKGGDVTFPKPLTIFNSKYHEIKNANKFDWDRLKMHWK